MAGGAVFLEHPSSLAHDTGPHPEQPARIVAIERELERRDWLGLRRLSSPEVERPVLAAVHPEPYIERIERLALSGGGQLDLDTVMSERSFEAALHAAGGAVRLVELIVAGEVPCGFSAHRPPGHHAESTAAMGFCLFNNVAVAAQHAIERLDLERVMIIDWDVHHGNGTNDIFHRSDRVLYLSIHQSPLYPGTGPASDAGSGDGTGFTVNLPVPPGTDDLDYRSLVQHVAVPLVRAFRPQLLLISAGYDAHRDDPLADCRVTEDGFAAMAGSLRRAGDEVGAPVGCVLEGGYALEPLGRSVVATIQALLDSSDEAVELTPLADTARRRLTQWWPQLG